jgi:hypothetical protein
LLIRPALKRLIARLATENGTTLSSQTEFMLEQSIAVKQMLDAMGRDAEEIAAGNADAALRRRGFTHHRIIADGRAWSVWAEPGCPLFPASGFVEPTAEELEAQAKAPTQEYTDEDLDRLWAEQHKEPPK